MTKIGVTQWSLDSQGPEALAEAAGLGFTAIQIDAGDLGGEWLLEKPSARQAYAQAAQDTRVTISAIAPSYVNTYGQTSPADSKNGRHCQKLIRIAIEAAAAMKVPLVFVPSFGAGEIHNELDLARTAEVLQEACALAAEHGLTVATENTLGPEQNLRLLKTAGQPNLRVLLDTQNVVAWGHDTAAMIEALWLNLADQIHVKDGLEGQLGNAPLGNGEGGFFEAARRLVALGFDGTVISENDYHGERRAWADLDLAAVLERWRQD